METDAVGLGAHEGEGWFEDFVGELLVVGAHALPEVVDDVFGRDGACLEISKPEIAKVTFESWALTVWQHMSARDWNQFLIVRLSLGKRHVFEQIIDEEEHREQPARKVDPVVLCQGKIQTSDVRKPCVQESLFSLGIWEVPMLKEVCVDFFSDLFGPWMVERLPV